VKGLRGLISLGGAVLIKKWHYEWVGSLEPALSVTITLPETTSKN